jgi:hypothetical protein
VAAVADAQTPLPQTAGSQFDRTYALVSSAEMTQTFTVSIDGSNAPMSGLDSGTTHHREGAAAVLLHFFFGSRVGSRGELGMQSDNPAYDQPS